MKNQPTALNPINVMPRQVADLKQYFPDLTTYEAIRLLQQEELRSEIETFRQDFRSATVVTSDTARVKPALENIAIILQDILEVQIDKR